ALVSLVDLLIAADPDGQRARLGAFRAAAHRRVEQVQAVLGERVVNAADRRRRVRGEVEQHGSTLHSAQEAVGTDRHLGKLRRSNLTQHTRIRGMASYLEWLQDLPFPMWIAGSESLWSFPFVLFLHAIGMGLSVGAAFVVCMRLVGVGRPLPVSSLRVFFKIF